MNQIRPLRMAVVGVGSLGQHHARKLSQFDDTELIAVVDPNETNGRAVAERLSTQWLSDVSQLPDDLDAVVVATPTTYHMESAGWFLDRGVPTFVEKPLAPTVAEAEKLSQAAAATGTVLQVGHIERFNPAFEITRSRCEQPLYIRCQRVAPYTFRSTDIGVVHDLMIHDIDLVLALCGETPVDVSSFGAVGIGPHEDMAVARLTMPSGVIVDITSSRMCPEAERSLQVWTTTGCLQADLHSRCVSDWQARGSMKNNPALVHSIAAATSDPRTLKDRVFGEWIQAEEIQAGSEDAMELELKDFIESVRQGREPAVSGRDGVAALKVAEQVLHEMKLWSYQTNAPAAESANQAA